MLRMIFFACWVIAIIVIVGSTLWSGFQERHADVQSRRTSLIWIPYAVLIWVLVNVIPHGTWTPLIFSRFWLKGIGDFIVLVGAVWVLWARWTLGRNFTESPVITREHRLTTNGPYRITRHPIYTGILTMLFGSMLFYGFGLAILILLSTWGVFLVKLRTEERLLMDRYKNEYTVYSKNVPQLFPRVRLRKHSAPTSERD